MDAIPMPNRSTALVVRTEHPNRHLIYDFDDIKNRITVRPGKMGGFKVEEGPFSGEVNGCTCISIAGAITIHHGMDETLRINVKGIGEIKEATMFSVVETGEPVKQMQLRPGGNQGTLRFLVAGVQIDIDGAAAVLVLDNSRAETLSRAVA